MAKKKILIIIADVGHGHRSAANSLTAAFEKLYPQKYDLKTIDLFEEAEIEPFNSSDISYKFLSQNRAYESISNGLWKLTNSSIGYQFFKSYLTSKLLDESTKIILDEKPDLVISAFPLTSSIIGEIKKRHSDFKYAVVVTDLITLHRSWADPHADLIFCPTSDAVKTLVNFGINTEKIVYPLFPLHPKLQNFRSKQEILRELEFDSNVPTVLLTGGGLGSKALNKAIDKLAQNQSIQLIIVAGKLESFRKELEKKYRDFANIRILGFVNNMQEYLNASDILIGKPGATTVMEVELFDKKAIFTRYIGEHDLGNIEYALRDPKIRYIGDDWSKLEDAVEDLLNVKTREADHVISRRFDESEKIVNEMDKLLE
jgi:1,2-diacylglycerol 3-beta-galactosyltransferase